jgi:hypothetical protein
MLHLDVLNNNIIFLVIFFLIILINFCLQLVYLFIYKNI